MAADSEQIPDGIMEGEKTPYLFGGFESAYFAVWGGASADARLDCWRTPYSVSDVAENASHEGGVAS